MSEEPLVARDGMAATVGIEFGELGAQVATATVEVTEQVLQPRGIVHGGVHSVIAESLCSLATWLAVRDDGMIAMGQSNSATFMRPISEGTIHAEARSRHRGRTTWVWDVELTDDSERLCALVRMTIAVRPAA